MTSALAVVLYFAGVAALAVAAVGVRRPIPKSLLVLFALVPFIVFFPDIALDKTHLPTDQTFLFRGPDVGPRNPWLNDLVSQNLPWTEKVRETWRSGGLPLRDRWNGCGTPLAGNGPAGAFSPLTLLAVVLPLPRAFGLAAAWKLLAALLGTWLWLRELHASHAAALFGAVSFAFSGSILPWILYPIAAAVSVWPWVFFGVERLRDGNGRGRAYALLVAVFAAWPLLGHIESVVSGVALLALVLAARWVSGDLPDAPRLLTRVTLAGLTGAGLAAFALLPQAFAILASNRRSLAEVPFYAPHLSLSPHGLIWPLWRALISPRAYGDWIASPMLANTAAFPEMGLGFFGVAGWATALLVFRRGSPRSGIALALIAGILTGAGIGFGAWPLAEITARLPALRWMFPLRFLSWVALAGSALAALELDRWLRDARSAPGKAALAAAGAAALLALLALETQNHYSEALGRRAALPAQVAAIALPLWCLTAFALAASLIVLRSPAAPRAVPYVLVAITGGELALQAVRQYSLGPAAEVFPGTPVADFLRSRPRPFRIVGEGVELFPGRSVFANVEDVRTHDPVERRDYVDFLNATCGYPPADYFKRVANINAPALDFLNVRYLVAAPGRAVPAEKWLPVYWESDGTVFENRDVLPRVFAPRQIAGVEGKAPHGWIRTASLLFRDVLPQISRLPDFRAKAFVVGEPTGERSNGEADISDYAETGRRASFRSRAMGAVVLVASLVQDGGWEAHDEGGKALPTSLANGPFLALAVPAGDHRVFLVYRPPGWRAGLAVSLVTATLLAGAAAGSKRRKR